MKDSYHRALARGVVDAIGNTPTFKQWRRHRKVKWVKEYRAAIVADPALAAAKLLRWLAGGRWWTRAELMRRHAIKRADVLTTAIEGLVALGRVEVVVRLPKRGGQPTTCVRRVRGRRQAKGCPSGKAQAGRTDD